MAETVLEGVLVKSSLTGEWKGKCTDKEVTEEVHNRNNTAKDGGEWRKPLFPESTCGADNVHARWINSIWKLRSFNYDRTWPWETGERLLKAGLQDEHEVELNRLWSNCQEAFLAFKDGYEDLKRLAKIGLNGTWKASDYRDIDKIEARWGWSLTFRPIPQASHFMANLTGKAIERAKAELIAGNEAKIAKGVADMWKRVIDPLMHMAQTLANPTAIFRDTLVANVNEVADLIPAINIQNDPALAQMQIRIRDMLAGISAEALRENLHTRIEVAGAAVTILEQFGQVGKRKLSV